MIPLPGKLNYVNYRLVFVVTFAAVVLISGCTIKAPDAPLEKNVSNLEVSATRFGSLEFGSHVAGIIQVSLPDSLKTFPIGRVALYLDSTDIDQLNSPPYVFNLDTRMYPQGGHIVTLAVYEQRPTMGLLNLVGAPRLECVDTLFFDQTPPPPITGVSISGSDTVTVRWNPSQAPNFRKYIAWVVFTSQFFGPTYAYKDTIFVRDSSEVRIPAPAAHVAGTTVTAQVGQSNGAATGAIAAVTGAVGTQLPVAKPIVDFWMNRNVDASYAFTADGNLCALSPDGLTVVRSGSLTPGQSAMFNADGSRCYVFSPSRLTITSYSTRDFGEVSSFRIDSAAATFSSAIIGSNGRIYVSNYQGIVWTYDSDTGQLLNSFTLPGAPWINPVMAISSDGSTLFITDESWSICKVNLQADPPYVEDSVELSKQASIDCMGVTQDQKYLVVGQFGDNSIKLLNTGNLSLAATLPLPDTACGVQAHNPPHSVTVFTQDGDELIAVSSTPIIAEFNLLTRNIDRTWCVINAPGAIGVSLDGQHLFLGGLGTPVPNFILDR